MAGFTRELVAQTNSVTMCDDIVNTLVNGNGVAWFTRVQPDIVNPTTSKILLESTPALDAYQGTDATQKFRLYIVLTKVAGAYNTMRMYFGDAGQLSPLKPLNDDVIVQPGTPGFLMMDAANCPSNSQEVNYRLSLTDRGFALGVWATASVNSSNMQGFCVVQRPVNPTTGAAVVAGKAPIFAMWHGADSVDNFFNWGIVREKDVSASLMIGSTNVVSRNNMFKVTMDWSHPNLFDNNAHVVKFPYGFATRRHLYLDELDLMCLVNAAAFAGSQDIKITMYGEAAERQYKSIWGSVDYGSRVQTTTIPKIVAGARIGILAVGGGIA